MFLEVTTATGATASALSTQGNYAPASSPGFMYTDAALGSGQTIPGIVNLTASCPINRILYSGVAANNYGAFIPLNYGGLGVKSVQQVQFTYATASASNCALVLCIPLAVIPFTVNNTAVVRSKIWHSPSVPVIQDGACLNWLIYPGAAAASASYFGMLDFVWG